MLPDINTPLPDLAHESLRQSTVSALALLADHVEQLMDAFLLGQTAADGLAIALTNFLQLQTAVMQIQARADEQAQQIADLAARVAALENPPQRSLPKPPSAPFSF